MAGAQLFDLEELWRIYTFYTLHGNPLDPEHLRSQQLIKMLSKDRECRYDLYAVLRLHLKESPSPLLRGRLRGRSRGRVGWDQKTRRRSGVDYGRDRSKPVEA